MSSSISSSSFGKCTLGIPFCFCEEPATLRLARTAKNPGRPFLGCLKYNTKGLPYCRFFKWVDINEEENELQQRESTNEFLMKEKEVEKKLDNVHKREIEVMKKELVLREQEAEIKHSRRLLWLYWTFALLWAFWLLLGSV
ncbi:uncharacterized protein LOC121262122 [Juglans microcarpa x Juglans regia]|uniref:uncharacterized protein LOC121262122 n=1 Tax=Juglans microcarpa x Juglans regia TaxID=2249226 RepID=UPI001B7DF26F|nr:uncharacterized protein LOC121262122 [Juglans microcarpa x Juglans regia]